MARKDCPHCAGTGWKPVEPDGARAVTRCECQDVERAEVLLRAARIPRRYEHCALENFDVRKSHETGQPNQSLARAKVFAGRFVEDYPSNDFGLLFYGPTGVGKTHLGVAVLRALMERKGVECLFYDFLKLLKDIRDSWNRVSQTSELTVLEPVLDVEVLLLDELGASNPTDWVRETLHHIINSRYNAKKVTLITTTLRSGGSANRGDVRTPGGEALPDLDHSLNQLGVTLVSRLYEMCKVVEMSSDDFRKAVMQASNKFHME